MPRKQVKIIIAPNGVGFWEIFIGGQIETKFRINSAIRASSVRVIDENGNNLGVLPINQAINLARQRNLDLVEIAPNANPPVCRIVQYSKFSYEQNKKARLARKKQHSSSLKEIQFRPNIGEHDFQIKINRIRDFLSQNHKVRVVVNLFGRAMNHRELGQELINKIITQLQDIARVEQPPVWLHRSYSTIFIRR